MATDEDDLDELLGATAAAKVRSGQRERRDPRVEQRKQKRRQRRTSEGQPGVAELRAHVSDAHTSNTSSSHRQQTSGPR